MQTTDDPTRMIAAIRIRGLTGIKSGIKDTLQMLHLYRKNYCTVIKATPDNVGMLNKTKDYITWGYLSEEVFAELVKKKGEPHPKDNTKLKAFFRLHPPIKGFERKGIKKPYNMGGALGFRGEAINDLIKRMM
jgi:large subunit ribosomal protein L30